MTVILDLTPEEQSRLRQLAARRGRQEDEQAHDLFRRSLDSEWLNEDIISRPGPEEMERLMAAAKTGDREARRRLLFMTPPVAAIEPQTGERRRPIPDEALRRENMYEDRC